MEDGEVYRGKGGNSGMKNSGGKKVTYHFKENQFFINPYNFVPVDFKRKKTSDIKEIKKEETHTGVLECSLITKSPLAIPDTYSVEGDEHKEYDFMRNYENKPMIPASSLRGPIRSMYETLTDSCFSTERGDAFLTYRAKKPFKPGLLHKTKDGWELYKAKRYVFGVDDERDYDVLCNKNGILYLNPEELKKYEYGEEVCFTSMKSGKKSCVKELASSKCKQKDNGLMQVGYFCKGEPFSRKHFESIFEKREEGKEETVSGDVLEKCVMSLDKIIDCYNDEKVNLKKEKGKEYYEPIIRKERYQHAKEGAFLPIWYQIEGEHVYLSVAAVGRYAFNNVMNDLLGERISCSKRSDLCVACRLFGMVKSDEAVSSRIRITDALAAYEIARGKRETLQELSSPKPSYLPFYLQLNGDKNAVWSYDSEGAEIRGRKFYWHSLEKGIYSSETKTERNSSMELLGKEEEVLFRFQVYYDKLTSTELEQIIWTLTLGENSPDSKKCYKIGHGKPIGLGSAKIVINKRVERRFSENRYTNVEKEVTVKENDFTEREILDAVLEITDLDACGYPASYPAVVDGTGKKYADTSNEHAAHQWFSFNFKLGGIPKVILPKIGEQNFGEEALKQITDEPMVVNASYTPNGKIKNFFRIKDMGL